MPLQNSQYDAIMRDYSQKQFQSRYTLDEHKREVYEKIPRLREIEQDITSISLQAVRRRLTSKVSATADAAQSYKRKIAALGAERKKLLTSAGYPEDYLTIQYHCPLCQDTGYIDGQKCQCFRKAAVELLYTQSNLKEILEKENFDSFSFDYYSDTIKNEVTGLSAQDTAKDAVQKARQFIESFDREFHNLFLYGNTGVGKTFLSHCIAKELIDRANCVIYFSAFDLFDTLAKETFQRDALTAGAQEDILSCDLLIIDDLGTELTNSFVASALFQCINERIMRKKSTIISTNLSLDQFSDLYSERIFSRITSHYTMIKLIGNDIRVQKRLLGGKQ